MSWRQNRVRQVERQPGPRAPIAQARGKEPTQWFDLSEAFDNFPLRYDSDLVAEMTSFMDDSMFGTFGVLMELDK